MDRASGRIAGGIRAGAHRHHPMGRVGPFFGWSDTWQLVINTGTTIVTFLALLRSRAPERIQTCVLPAPQSSRPRSCRGRRRRTPGIGGPGEGFGIVIGFGEVSVDSRLEIDDAF